MLVFQVIMKIVFTSSPGALLFFALPVKRFAQFSTSAITDNESWFDEHRWYLLRPILCLP